jgi:prepilin-type N-terminal cleavage/methylation domain-containing protein
MRNTSGFTLIEVLIAMVLLAFLTIFTAHSINDAIHSREKIQHDIDRYSTLRDAMKVIERDVNGAFNYQDFNARLFNMALKARATMAQQNQSQQTQTPAGTVTQPVPTPTPGQQQGFQETYQQKAEWKYSAFIGEKSALDLTTLSNVRMAEDQQMSMQAEIGYHLKNCRRRASQGASSNCLWRRVAPVIDDDPTKGGHETVLLENVSKFELRYLGPGKEKEWIDTWITSERGDDMTKGKFPYAVEVTLEVQDKNTKDKPLRMTIVASVRNPNNPNPNDPTNPANQPGGGNQPIQGTTQAPVNPTSGAVPSATN